MSSRYDLLLEELSVNTLPSLPQILSQVLDVCMQPDSSARDLTAVIGQDSVMTARIVAVAGAAANYHSGRTLTLDRAVMMIGAERVKTLALTVALQQFFASMESRQLAYLSSYWRHSLNTALLSRALATLTGYSNPEQAYLAGLLHNVGELILKTGFPQELANLERSGNDAERWLDTEMEQLGVDHCELGACLLERWKLGTYAVAAARYHHKPLEVVLDAQHLVKVVYLASLLSTDHSAADPALLQAGDRLFGLTPSLLAEIRERIRTEVGALAAQLQIEIDQIDEQTSAQRLQLQQVELARRIRSLSLLSTVRSHFAGAESRYELLQAVNESVSMLFGYPGALVLVADASGEHLELVLPAAEEAGAGDESEVLRLHVEPHRSLAADCFLQQVLVIEPDSTATGKELAAIDHHLREVLGVARLIYVPMLTSDGVVGVLVSGHLHDRPAQKPDQNMLRLFAQSLAERLQLIDRHTRLASGNASPAGIIEETQLQRQSLLHEINNPLAIIRNYLDVLALKLGEAGAAPDELGIIRDEIDRAGQILLQLRELKDEPALEPEDVDVNQEIGDLVSLFSGSLFVSHDINVRTDYDGRLQPVLLSRHALRQVLVNLIKNAVEAMPAGGELCLRTCHQVSVSSQKRGRQEYCEIIVEDSGPGIPQAVYARLFQPGTSTKGGQHSGLGLSISRNLVIDMGGSIQCRTGSGGTRFDILLPYASAGGNAEGAIDWSEG